METVFRLRQSPSNRGVRGGARVYGVRARVNFRSYGWEPASMLLELKSILGVMGLVEARVYAEGARVYAVGVRVYAAGCWSQRLCCWSQSLCCWSQTLSYHVKIGSAQVLGL